MLEFCVAGRRLQDSGAGGSLTVSVSPVGELRVRPGGPAEIEDCRSSDRGVSQLPELPVPLAFCPMRRRFLPLALCLGLHGVALGLDSQSQKLADRYLGILIANPMQQTAFDRLWKIYADVGEIEGLVALCQQQAAQVPVLYGRVLQRAGRAAEAKKVLGTVKWTGS